MPDNLVYPLSSASHFFSLPQLPIMTVNLYVSAFKGVGFACLLTFLIQILMILFSPISPDILEVPPESTWSRAPWNNHLKRVSKVGDGLLDKPEDVCFDEEGTLYTVTRDGWIKKMHRNGSWEDWKMLGGDGLLGIALSSKSGNLLVCDADKGLLQVNEEGVSVLASQMNGSKIRFADEVIEASDGNIYFSDVSSKFGLHNWYLDVLEAKPHGRLLKYNPNTKETSALLENLCFPNGVALSRDQDFLVVCETWKFRCLKYWLKGEMTGKSEIFIDNLPGGPDNINLAPDGSFWIALLEMNPKGLEFIHKSKAAKRLVAIFPKLVELIKGVHKKAMVMKVNKDGKVINKFDDFDGNMMSFVTTAVEFEGHIYLGSLNTNFIGKLQLTPSLVKE